jgi:hypothetical protein
VLELRPGTWGVSRSWLGKRGGKTIPGGGAAGAKALGWEGGG